MSSHAATDERPLELRYESVAAPIQWQFECEDDDGGNATHAKSKSAETDKQPKSKGKSASRRGLTALSKKRGTGFEEYFADSPITPDEAAEERAQIYASDKPFEERIQSCIQRFRTRRRLQNEHTLFFNEYLFLGGINTLMKAFEGIDKKDLEDLTPAERREAMAADAVHTGSGVDSRFYDGNTDHWSVDFTGVLAGFLSTSFVVMTGAVPKEMESGIIVVENFLRYVLHHDVCPEHDKDVRQALQLCADAKKEWPLLAKLRALLPGPFHLAAAELSTTRPTACSWRSVPRPECFDAKTVFYSACALLDETRALKSAPHGNPCVTKEYDCTLEVAEVRPPSESIANAFRRLSIDGSQSSCTPIGMILLKPATIEDGWEIPPMPATVDEAGMWIYFDEEVLENMKPGMKLELTICELDVGIRFVKFVSNVVPTYCMFLPQVLMKHYKSPRPNERPAPSATDPMAEEQQHIIEANDE